MSLPDAATDLAEHLVTLGAGPRNRLLEVGKNVFVGPERATRAEVSDCAAFIQAFQGAAPEPYINNRSDFWRFAVQVLVRSESARFAEGEELARHVVAKLHRAPPAGYVTCLAQSAPAWLGEDESRRHRWSLNFELWWKG